MRMASFKGAQGQAAHEFDPEQGAGSEAWLSTGKKADSESRNSEEKGGGKNGKDGLLKVEGEVKGLAQLRAKGGVGRVHGDGRVRRLPALARICDGDAGSKGRIYSETGHEV